MVYNKLSDFELDVVISGVVKTIVELKCAAEENYPEIVLLAIRNDLDEKYSQYFRLVREKNKREDSFAYVG